MAVQAASPFVWGAGGARMTPDEIAAERKVAQALMQKGMDYSPIQSPWQGAARVAQAMMGGLDSARADAAARANAKAEAELLSGIIGGGATAAPAAAAPSASMPMGATSIPAGKDEFVNSVMPLAQEASAKTGLDPRLIVAQAALESGWGKSAPGNNLFGIKSHGQPGGNILPTTEVVNGQPMQTTDSFRAYASPAESVQGYTDFITSNPRYKPMMAAQGLEAQAAALGQSGYATDPNYGQKVLQIARSLPTPAAASAAPVVVQNDLSPLDTAQWPAGPVNGPSDAAALPATAQTTQGALPVAPASPFAGVNPRLLSAMSSPYISDGTKKVLGLVLQKQMEQGKVSTVDLGNSVGIMDARGNIVRQIPKERDQMDAESKRLDIDKKRRELDAAPTVQRIKQPDGSEVAVQWDRASGKWVPLVAPEGGNPVASPKLTEQQSKDVGFYNRGQKLLPRLEQQDQALTDFLSTSGGSIHNYFKSDAFRQAEQTGRELLAVILRKDTGAAVTPSEFELYNAIYLPKPGDDLGTVQQKRVARQTAVEGLRMGLGTAEIIFRSREAAEVAKNAGRQPTAAQPTQAQDGATATNPQTGERMIFLNGKWEPFT